MEEGIQTISETWESHSGKSGKEARDCSARRSKSIQGSVDMATPEARHSFKDHVNPQAWRANRARGPGLRDRLKRETKPTSGCGILSSMDESASRPGKGMWGVPNG